MNITLREVPLPSFAAHSRISIAFDVDRILDISVDDRDPSGFTITEHPIDPGYTKDFDTIHGNHPTDWPARFDVSQWGLITAFADDQRVGGAVIAFNTPGLELLEGKDDLAVLWDIRIDPEFRRAGIGAALFRAAEQWARRHGCTELKIETQNTNVNACRFYARQGCTLAEANRHAYRDFPTEILVIWRKHFTSA